MNRRILEHFNIEKKGHYTGPLFRTYVEDVQNAVHDNDMLALIGPVGSGKTTVFKHAALNLKSDPDKSPLFVHVRNKDKENMSISSIMNAAIYDLSSENPRHDLEARGRQFIRVVGMKHVNENRNICIVIEEAHRLHTNTLRALKELREDEFAGVSPLFSCVLIGHPTLHAKLTERTEVFWRSQIISFEESAGWMLYEDRIKYLRAVYADALTQGARKRIAAVHRVPLEMDWFVERKMVEAYQAGMKQLTEECFEMTPKELLEALNSGKSVKDEDYIALDDIAREAGVGKTTVFSALNDPQNKKRDVVTDALNRLAETKVRKVA